MFTGQSFGKRGYNIAGRTAINIEPVTMARIAELDEVKAVKEPKVVVE